MRSCRAEWYVLGGLACCVPIECGIRLLPLGAVGGRRRRERRRRRRREGGREGGRENKGKGGLINKY